MVHESNLSDSWPSFELNGYETLLTGVFLDKSLSSISNRSSHTVSPASDLSELSCSDERFRSDEKYFQVPPGDCSESLEDDNEIITTPEYEPSRCQFCSDVANSSRMGANDIISRSSTDLSSRTHGNTDGSDEEPSRKRQKTDKQRKSILACPFYKHDPARYSGRNLVEKEYRNCSSCYLTNISNLKQHIKRVHCKPAYYCPRCCQQFLGPDDLDAHIRQETVCKILHPPLFEERISHLQFNEIAKKKPNLSIEMSWKQIYEIIFPGCHCPKSIYIEDTLDGILSDFVDYLQRDGPKQLASIVEERMAPLLFDNSQKQHLLSICDKAVNEWLHQLNLRSDEFSSFELESIDGSSHNQSVEGRE